jgi:peptidoglycan-associated lipoprotein
MGSFRKLLAASVIVASTVSRTAGAQQSIEDLRAKFRLPVPEVGLATETGRFPRGAPGTSSGSPIAFGANWNDAFIGAGIQAPVRYSANGDTDGSASFGFGLGNGSDVAGLEVTVNALSSIRSGVGNRVGFGFKAHKILPDGWGAALGVQGVQLNPGTDDRNTVYGVVTKSFDLAGTALGQFKSFTWSGGLGTETFQTAGNLNTGKHGVGVFTSAALRVNEVSSVILDWSGQDLNLGVSFVPFKSLPLVLSPAISDLTGASNSNLTIIPGQTKKTGPRFTLGVGFAFKVNPSAGTAASGPSQAPTVTAEQAEVERAAMAAVRAEEDRRRQVADAARARADEERRRAAAATEEKNRAAAVVASADAERNKGNAALDAVRAAVAKIVYYDFDKDEIRDDQKASLDAKIPVLQANPSLKIRIAGHTDERGSDEYNLALSQRRAASAKRYLVSRGITADRVETVGFGEERPVDAGHTEEAWAKNRRAEFEITAGGENLKAPQR